MSSCQAEDYKEDEDNTIGDISIWNYPVTDGSDSTEPLRTILMCKLLGFSYQWEDFTPMSAIFLMSNTHVNINSV